MTGSVPGAKKEASSVTEIFENTPASQRHHQRSASHGNENSKSSLHVPSSSVATTLPRVVPSIHLQLPQGDATTAVVDEGLWIGPAKTITVVNGLTFRSNFDSGNLMKVVLPAEQGGVGGVYQLWTARDCEGGPNIKRNSSWFYFGVAGGSTDQIITMKMMNLNNQNTLYKHGMTPVFRLSGNPLWARLRQKVTFEEHGRHLQLQFHFRFTRDAEEVFFAFCFPHSYEDCKRDLERCEDQAMRDGMAVQALLTPKPGPTGYFHRELLIRTPEGRRVDLLTVTDCHGILDEREPRINPHLFPGLPSKRRPFEFEGKDVVFVSARVHPGETPASFVFQGILRFLLDSGDPRAAELRRRFVFKLIPLLNPDGIAAGHFRQDSYGNNLNRHYADPHPERHASVYAAKSVVMHHAARPAGRGRLTVYLDLHAHASTRGCFMYGNHLPNLEDQAENQLLPLLMTLNTPHFDFASCNFTLKHMSRVDSGDGGLSAEGTGRVFYGRHAGVLRSYTLECNYNTGKTMCNHVPPASRGKGGRFASPERLETSAPRYHPGIWRGVGEGFLKALLDAEGASVWSRLPQSKFRSLERARKFLVNELRSQPAYREQSLRLRRGASVTTPPLPPPPHKELRGVASSPSQSSSVPALSGQTAGNNAVVEATDPAELEGGSSAVASPRTVPTRRTSHPPPLLLPKRPHNKSATREGVGEPELRRATDEGEAEIIAAPSTATKLGMSSKQRSCSGGRSGSTSKKSDGGISIPPCTEGTSSSSRSGSGRSIRTASARKGGAQRQPPHPVRSDSRDAETQSMRRKRLLKGTSSSEGGGDQIRRASYRSEHRKDSTRAVSSASRSRKARHRRASSSATGVSPGIPPRVLQPPPATTSTNATTTPPSREERRIGLPSALTVLSSGSIHVESSGLQQPAPGWERQASDRFPNT